jgi:hypothetical protein
VLAPSRTLAPTFAGAAACASASLTAAARGALPKAGRDEGMVVFRSNKGMRAVCSRGLASLAAGIKQGLPLE